MSLPLLKEVYDPNKLGKRVAYARLQPDGKRWFIYDDRTNLRVLIASSQEDDVDNLMYDVFIRPLSFKRRQGG